MFGIKCDMADLMRCWDPNPEVTAREFMYTDCAFTSVSAHTYTQIGIADIRRDHLFSEQKELHAHVMLYSWTGT